MQLPFPEKSIFVGGQWVLTEKHLVVTDPNTGKEVGICGLAGTKELEKAVELANHAKQAMRELPSYKKYSILSEISKKITDNKEDISNLISLESGKPKRYSVNETERAAETFRIAAEESKRMPAEYISLDWTKGSSSREGVVRYFPAGVVAGISPFNFPLNLVAHKVAPAIAAGCPIVIKPASATPLTALYLASICKEAGLPEGGFSVIPCSRETGNLLTTHNHIDVLSFTGSPDVGWKLKEQAGKKKVVLELGGNAGVIIDESADVSLAIERCLVGGYAYAGQVCIHVQRIYVHEKIVDSFIREFTNKVKLLMFGNALNIQTEMNCMIDEKQALRVEMWLNEAVRDGATILAGGTRKANKMEPTVITGTKKGMRVLEEEVFGPVVVIEKITSFDEGINKINDSRFGLQAGIFTRYEDQVQKAFAQLQVGGVIVNDVPTFRADHMPYGGVKDSGQGREGVKYAMMDYLEPKILVRNRVS